MSSLTKVFVVLVSALTMFLCGAVVTFVVSAEDWRGAYESQKSLAEAAQVQALAAEDELIRGTKRSALLIERQNDQMLDLEKEFAAMLAELTGLRQAKAQAERKASAAVAALESSQQTLDNMYNTQNAVQAELDKSHRQMITAQAQVIELNRQFNSEQVKSARLESIRMHNAERIAALEDENIQIRLKLQEVAISPSEMQSLDDRVSSVAVSPSGVPIRGQIVDMDDDLAAISVGSSAGVQKDMTFVVLRSGKYLGDLRITHVEPTESAGQLVRHQGTIVPGDYVTTGFD